MSAREFTNGNEVNSESPVLQKANSITIFAHVVSEWNTEYTAHIQHSCQSLFLHATDLAGHTNRLRNRFDHHQSF